MTVIPLAIKCAGFETGDLSEFDGSYTDTGCIAEASQDVSYRGSWSGKFQADDAEEDAYVYWTYDGQDEVYARFYCYFHTSVPASWFFFMRFKDTSDNIMLKLDIDFDIPVVGDILSVYCAAEDTWYHAGGFPPKDMNFQDDTWYCFEVRLVRHSTAGIIQVWVDGVLEIDESGLNTQNAFDQIGRAEFGVMNDHGGTTIYFDDICIDDERIYCLSLTTSTSTSSTSTSSTSTSTTSTSTTRTTTTSTSTSSTSTSTTSTSTTSTSTTSTSTSSTSTSTTSTSTTSTSTTSTSTTSTSTSTSTTYPPDVMDIEFYDEVIDIEFYDEVIDISLEEVI